MAKRSSLREFYERLAEFKGQFHLRGDRYIRCSRDGMNLCPLDVVYGPESWHDSLRTGLRFATHDHIVGAADNSEAERCRKIRRKMVQILGLDDRV